MTRQLIKCIFFLIVVQLTYSCDTMSTKQKDKPISELDTISFDSLSYKACAYLKEQQEICRTKYKLDSYQNWFYDQETGELTFSDNGVKKLIIDYEEVGSISLATNTWLWAWDNPYVGEKVKSKIIKEYGKTRDFEKLTTPKWTANIEDGWDMTAISAYLLNAKGTYRVPIEDDSLFVFMIFKNIRWADTTKK